MRLPRKILTCIGGSLSVLSVIVGTSVSAAPSQDTGSDFSTLPNFTLPTPPQTPAPGLPEYLLGPGDQIDVRVYGYDEYTGPLTILPDGTVSLAVIGRVVVTGLTVDQFAKAVKLRLDPLLVNPVVEIKLLQLRPVLVMVSGEVQRPGPTQLRGLTPTSPSGSNSGQSNSVPTLSEAIALAGGVTRNADLKNIMLKRLNTSGQYDTQTINLWEAVQASTPSNLLLRDGDIISIPKAEALSTDDQRSLARSSFAPETVKVRVVGEVKKPGEVEVSPQSTLSSAIATAGGPTDKADLKKVAFVRLQEDGKAESQELNLEKLADTIQVQDGDVLIIDKKKRSKILDLGTSIASPLGSLGNLLFLLFR